MREYEPLWIKIKNTKIGNSVKIVAMKTLHKRIMKAVAKEKYMDLGFKIMRDKRTYILHAVSEGNNIVFRMEETIRAKDL